MERDLRKLVKKYSDQIIFFTFLAVGFMGLFFGEKIPPNFQVLADIVGKIGIAAIVSAFAWTVLNGVRSSIERTIESKSESLDQQAQRIESLSKESQIVNEARETGIVHIFRDRGTTDKEYEPSLVENFRKVPENGEVKIIGVTLSRFFGSKTKNQISTAILEMLERNVKIKLLILDPRSEAARYRAFVDQGELIAHHGYIASTILNELLDVIRRLCNPTPDWCLEEGLIERIKNQIEVRMYNTNPVLHLIILNKYIYVEQYHNGGGTYVRNSLKEFDRYINLDNYTGFVPVFKVKQEALYSKLMISHFDNIWKSDRVQNHSLNEEKVYTEVFDFIEEEWKKRRENGCL
ncbi:MAG: hypothetical protein AAF135_09890 [Bacteroidota bacterium]